MAQKTDELGQIYRIAGPVVTAIGIKPRMYDVVEVGDEKLMGEVIKLVGDNSIIQVYEDTSGVRPGEPVRNTGLPLVVELGPGLLTSIYDGLQRPLPKLAEKWGSSISRGVTYPGLDHEKKWHFVPTVKQGDAISGGQILGTVQETKNIVHRVLVPHGVSGKVAAIAEGDFTIDETVCTLDSQKTLTMLQKWPVRTPRPFTKKLMPDIPLVTGQRIFDTFFPLAKGGTAAIPGPFGSGKTVSQHQLAKWSDADIVVYIGCGERGNEMTEVLTEFPHLQDPKTGLPLISRTVLIANTSNMPVAAREASVYTGITIAEYYRDMGYSVSLMADSTSRWAEAMREISSRLEEMPGEEGYPAYLASKLAAFYERSGRVDTYAKNEGSITVIGAVSPPGGDFSEPVTQNTLRIVKVFWGLDAKLAHRRHFPSINWLTSYSLYTPTLKQWFDDNIDPDMNDLRVRSMSLLQKEAELQEIVQLVGSDTLPLDEQLILEVARMIREFFLQQNAYHEVDSFCSMTKQYKMLKMIMWFGDLAKRAVGKEITTTEQKDFCPSDSDVTIDVIVNSQSRQAISLLRFTKDFDAEYEKAQMTIKKEFALWGVVA